MKAEILTLLREQEGYLSGQELCSRFGVSRTAVWKAVNQLKEDGYEIDSVQNKGYRLLSSPDSMKECEIASRLHTQWAGRNAVLLKSTGSTNADAKRLAEEGAPHGTIVVTEQQTAGRGRRGRQWTSALGCNVYFTLVLRPSCAPDRACMLTLVMALAVAEAVRELGLSASIKWPNDVVLNGRKICGILTEMSAEPDYIHYVVIGTGVNVNQQEFPEEIKRVAGSLYLEKGEHIARAPLLARILELFEAYYALFDQRGDLSELMESYEALLLNKDSNVRVLDPKGEYEGVARGITREGELLVERENGGMERVYAGEVSVRGLYGYA